jgi:urea carboxylase
VTGDRLEVVDGGNLTTVQDYPGRLGYWTVGVPPNGPMDDRSFRLGNRVVGNPTGAPGLECTAIGPTLRFVGPPRTVCVAGADLDATLDGEPLPRWSPIDIGDGAVLRIGRVRGRGLRAYVLVAGGIAVPSFLGSASTFTLGGFGGHEGRALVAGDVLPLGEALAPPGADAPMASAVPAALIPELGPRWKLGVLEGPHGAPEFFTPADLDAFFAAEWRVHHHSARTGVRLVGPRPTWARPHGGDAGLHPSNIHDTGYAVGTIDFTGDVPVILGPDGPSLGGFVCPATVISSERWKLGQLAPGDTVRFVPVTPARAAALEQRAELELRTLVPPRRHLAMQSARDPDGGVLRRIEPDGERPLACHRRSGDRHLLVEYGAMTLDLELRARVHALDAWLAAHPQAGVVDTTPGIRSLLVQLDSRVTSVERLSEVLADAEESLPSPDDLVLPSRIVHLPLSWDDPATREAIARYMQVVRDDAPWCPSNIEFIRRINGLADEDAVREIVHAASYLVLGLGDVYLGAPVATPIDPRHRLVTTKYNPARTWTPPNAVGIGGAYLCIYGMEGPGGYQFVGRTLPVWDTKARGPNFEPGTPWLLRPFDQLRFHPIGAADLLDARADFAAGRTAITIEATTLSLAEHRRYLADHASEIRAWKTHQQAAFAAEREAWAAAGEFAA